MHSLLLLATISLTALYFSSTVSASVFSPGIVPEKCLQCLCDIQTGCKPTGCYNNNPMTCGYFLISEDYYRACGSPGSNWQICSMDKMCASLCIQNYMARYIGGCHSQNCLNYARLHHGGPSGCSNSAHLIFGLRVNKCAEM